MKHTLVTVIIFSFLACSSTDEPVETTVNNVNNSTGVDEKDCSSCPSPEYCLGVICLEDHPECTVAEDCEAGSACVLNTAERCTGDACPTGNICLAEGWCTNDEMNIECDTRP